MSGYRLHPLLLDGCLQLLAAALPADDPETLYLPVGVGSYTVFGDAGRSAGVMSRFTALRRSLSRRRARIRR